MLFLDLLGAFSQRRQQAGGSGPLGSSAPVTRLAAVRLGQHAERPPSLSRVWLCWDQRSECDGTRGRNGEDGRAAFTFTPGPGALNLRDWRAQRDCGRPEVMHKTFCSDKTKCPGFTPSEYFIFVPSLYRSCALKLKTATGISSHFHCYQFLVNTAFRIKRSWWLTRLKNIL